MPRPTKLQTPNAPRSEHVSSDQSMPAKQEHAKDLGTNITMKMVCFPASQSATHDDGLVGRKRARHSCNKNLRCWRAGRGAGCSAVSGGRVYGMYYIYIYMYIYIYICSRVPGPHTPPPPWYPPPPAFPVPGPRQTRPTGKATSPNKTTTHLTGKGGYHGEGGGGGVWQPCIIYI